MKLCHKCNTIKELNCFAKDRCKRDGHHTVCSICVKVYYKNNKEKLKEIKKIYRSKPENLEKEKIARDAYNERNLYILKEKRRQYRKKRKESGNPIKSVKFDSKKYRTEAYLERSRKHQMYKRLFDPNYRIKKNLRIRLVKALERNLKNSSAVTALGISLEDFRTYIEALFYKPEMTWETYGTTWELDHIIPLSSVDLTVKENAERLCHYTNMQPLTRPHNSLKKDRILTKEQNELLKQDRLTFKDGVPVYVTISEANTNNSETVSRS